MPATVEQITDAVKKLTSSRAYKTAESELDFAALCIVGTFDRVPRSFGDNEGAHPVRLVVTTGSPAMAPETYNRGNHSVGFLYHTLAYTYLNTRVHAEKMKAWLDEQLRFEPMLNGWYDGDAWQFEIMFGEAAKALGFETFDEDEKMRRVLARARRGA